jgi:hypothetical protein
MNNHTYTIEKAVIIAFETLKALNTHKSVRYSKNAHFGISSPRIEDHRKEFSVNCIRLLKSSECDFLKSI